MSDFASLKASITRPRTSVRLCLRGDLFAERERLNRDLARELENLDSLAGSAVAQQLRGRLDALTAEMEEATHLFEFEAVSRATFTELEDAYPAGDDGQPPRAFLNALVAASLVKPDLTADNVTELLGELSDGQVDVLESAAWAVNRETGTVPFSETG